MIVETYYFRGIKVNIDDSAYRDKTPEELAAVRRNIERMKLACLRVGMPLLRRELGGPPSIWPSGSRRCWDSNGPDSLRRTRSRTPGARRREEGKRYDELCRTSGPEWVSG